MASATPGRIPVWAVPLSLAATDGIDVSFYSCGYLDVSVPRVSSIPPMHSAGSNAVLPALCFHIQKSPDQCLFASFPELIAGYHVFRRLSMPRHPPYTLKSLITFIDHPREDLRFQISNFRFASETRFPRSRSSLRPLGTAEGSCRARQNWFTIICATALPRFSVRSNSILRMCWTR